MSIWRSQRGAWRRAFSDVSRRPGAGCNAAGRLRRMEPVGGHQRPHAAALQVPAPRHDAHVRPLLRRREAEPPAADPCAPPTQLAPSLHLLPTPSLQTCCVQRPSAWSPGGVSTRSWHLVWCGQTCVRPAVTMAQLSLPKVPPVPSQLEFVMVTPVIRWSLSCAASSKLPASGACGVCWRCGSYATSVRHVAPRR